MPPADVFDGLGTHALRGIVVGGRADYSVSANMLFEHEDRTIRVYAEVSLKAKLGLNVTNETVDQTSLDQFNSTREEHLEVYGGSSQLGQAIIDNGSYNAWLASIDDNPSFCDFTLNGLVPIWELADDAARQHELEQYFIESIAPQYDIELADLMSEFDTDDEGWTGTADGAAKWLDPANPDCQFGGCFYLNDKLQGTVYYFRAPETYFGNWARFYTGTLRYWFRNTHGVNVYETDVVVTGTGGTLGYFYDVEDRPAANTWTSYFIALEPGQQETGIWRLQTNGNWVDATAEDMQHVFARVWDFRIRGEMSYSEDNAFLDRVAVCKPDNPECNDLTP